MDYGQMVLSMLQHAQEKDDPADWALLLRAFGFGVANLGAWASNDKDRQLLLTSFFNATRIECEDIHTSAQNQAVH